MNSTRRLCVILNKSWKQHPTKQQLYGDLSPIFKTIQIRRTRHAEHCWRSKDELISDDLLWTRSNGHTSVGQSTKTYQQQLFTETWGSLEDLPEVTEGKGNDEKESRKSMLAAWYDDDDADLFMAVGYWLVVWVLWHIYLSRLFNAKPILNNSVQHQYAV